MEKEVFFYLKDLLPLWGIILLTICVYIFLLFNKKQIGIAMNNLSSPKDREDQISVLSNQIADIITYTLGIIIFVLIFF